MAARVARFRFDRVYGGWWGRVIVDDGAEAVRRSAERYIARLQGERPPPMPMATTRYDPAHHPAAGQSLTVAIPWSGTTSTQAYVLDQADAT